MMRRRAPSAVVWIGAALLIPLMLVMLAIWVDGENRVSEQMRLRSLGSSQREILLVSALARVKDADVARHDFIISGSPEAQARFAAARTDVTRMLSMPVFIGDPADIGNLRSLTARKFAEMDHIARLTRQQREAEAMSLLRSGRNHRLTDRIHTAVDRLMDQEQRLSAAQVDRYAQRSASTRRTMWAAIIAISLLLLIGMAILWNNRRQRHAAHIDAFEAAQRSRAILDSTIDAILILNPSGTIETVNAAATSMLGYSAEELQWRDVSLLIDIPPGSGSFLDRAGLTRGRRRSTVHVDRVARHKEGRRVPVDIAFGVMTQTSEQHIVMSLRDISERKRIERVKDDLISTVSHELRTPLTSVIGALGLLRAGAAGKMGSDAARLVEIAENNSRRLIRLINDMLDIDSIDSGKLQLVRAPIDIRAVATQACEGSQGLAAAGEVAIGCHIPDDPVIVQGDADRLLQVITNLVSNAIHVSRPGQQVDITVSCHLPSKALVSIEDRGPGVPLAFRDRIFGRFERADRSGGAGGTGLGLAISREIVTRHDGRIWFEDRPDGGTRFLFDIDLVRQDETDHEWEPSILVAAGDPDLAGQAEEIAAREGYACDVVRSAQAVRQALTRRRYAALIIDTDLPPHGGLALAHALYADDASADGDDDNDVPILLFTADAVAGAAVSADMPNWVEGPLDRHGLARALATALSRSTVRRPVILHVDDDHDMLEVTASALRADARIIKATNLAAARSIMQTTIPDVVILDVRLTDGDGYDLLPILVDKDGSAIPVIIYSAHDVSVDRARGVAAVLVKARGSLPDLRATVARVLAARQNPAAA